MMYVFPMCSAFLISVAVLFKCADNILSSLRAGGNVLVTVDTAGRVLELCQLLVGCGNLVVCFHWRTTSYTYQYNLFFIIWNKAVFMRIPNHFLFSISSSPPPPLSLSLFLYTMLSALGSALAEPRLRLVSVLPSPTQQCQLQRHRICKVTGKTRHSCRHDSARLCPVRYCTTSRGSHFCCAISYWAGSFFACASASRVGIWKFCVCAD